MAGKNVLTRSGAKLYIEMQTCSWQLHGFSKINWDTIWFPPTHSRFLSLSPSLSHSFCKFLSLHHLYLLSHSNLLSFSLYLPTLSSLSPHVLYSFFPACQWGLQFLNCMTLYTGKTPSKKGCPGYYTKLRRMVRFEVGECHFTFHYSQIHSILK